MMLGGCVNDYDTCDEPGKLPDEVPVSFVLKLDQLGDLFSRADGDGIWNPDDPGNPGSSFDNKIILSNTNAKETNWLHVMIINNTDGSIAHIDIKESELVPISNGYYQVTTKLNTAGKGWSEGTYRLMVIANFRDRQNESKDAHINKLTTLTELTAAVNSPVTWFESKSRAPKYSPTIPMWGVKTFTMNLDGTTSADVGEIKLLRAVAKVKIVLTQKLIDAGYTLVKAKLDEYYSKLMPCPNGWENAAETNDNSVVYDKSSNPNNGSKKSDSITITAPGYDNSGSGYYNETDGDGSLVFYLPETSDNKIKKTTITVTVKNDTGGEETCDMVIDNYPGEETNPHYANSRYNVNRNHLYHFTIDKDIEPGKLSYKLECWNYANSAIGWNPTDYEFSANSDSEAKHCYVSFPSYHEDYELIQNSTSFADYTFTFPAPAGAVWKAFLIEDGVEYTAEDKFTTNADGSINYASASNTPNGFFFGVGNLDGKNRKAVTSGVARADAYQVKVGSRLKTVDFDENKQPKMEDEAGDIIQLNANGQYWKEKGEVPTCYLVIKVAYDGINFTEELPINPDGGTSPFTPLKLAGTKTRIQIRHLFPFYRNKSKNAGTTDKKRDEAELIKGINSNRSDYSSRCWWSYPEGHKDAPATTNP
ncbi:MAG: hypothetical protein DBY35_09210 [Bacteroidales bacterium]|nr:MAG: hypothetical protein DBY35_09210 [Bacteroidales bacterium]